MRPGAYLSSEPDPVSPPRAGLATVDGKPRFRTGPVSAWLGACVALLAQSLAWMVGPAEAPEIELAEVEQARLL
jgi:hypothetical protein